MDYKIYSHPMCEYCGIRPALKTNGKSKNECSNMAMYGKCEGLTPIRKTEEPSRNHPCPCGSGKKYKNCHKIKK